MPNYKYEPKTHRTTKQPLQTVWYNNAELIKGQIIELSTEQEDWAVFKSLIESEQLTEESDSKTTTRAKRVTRKAGLDTTKKDETKVTAEDKAIIDEKA